MKHITFSFLANRILLGGVVFLLPLFFLPLSGFSLSFTKMAIVTLVFLFAAGLFLIDILQRGEIIVPRSLIYALACALLSLVLLAGLFSPVLRVSFLGDGSEMVTVIGFLVFMGIFLLAGFLPSHEDIPKRLYKYLNITAIILFTYQILNTVFLMFGKSWLSFGLFTSVTSSPIGSWYDLGLFAGFVALSGVLAYLSPGKKKKTFLSSSLFVVSLAIAALVNFSLVWILLALTALVVVVFSISFGRRPYDNEQVRGEDVSRFALPIAPIVVLIISVFFLLPGSLVSSAISKMGFSYTQIRPSLTGTTSVVTSVWKSDIRSALLGEGPNRFANAWMLHKPAGINNTIVWNSSFDYGVGFVPTFAATTGILGILAWVVFIGGFLYLALNALGRMSRESSRFYAAVSLFILVVYAWIVMITFVPGVFFVAMTFLLSGVLMGVLRAEGAIPTLSIYFSQNPKIGFVGVFSAVILLVGTVVSLYGLTARTLSVYHFGSGLRAVNVNDDWEKGAKNIISAVNLYETDTYDRALASLFTKRLYQISGNADATTVKTQFQEFLGNAITAAKKAVAYDASSPSNYAALGDVYAAVASLNITGAYESAAGAYNQAIDHDPQNPVWYVSLARLEIGQKNMTGARDYIRKALAVKGDYVDAIFLQAQIEAGDGNIKEAIALSEETVMLAPNDVGALFQLGLLHYKDSSYDTAIAPLERALLIYPDYANAKYFLGLSYSKVGRTADAIVQFEGLAKTNPDNVDVSLVLSNLKAGLPALSGMSASPADGETPPVDE